MKFLTLFVIWSLFFMLLYSCVSTKKDYTYMDCAEFGVCKEGLTTNTSKGQITITKDTCLQNNWLWNDKEKVCDIRHSNN